MLIVLTEIASISIDCPAVIQLAIGMNLDIKQPGLMSQLRNDCCTSNNNPDTSYYILPFVKCNSGNRVTELHWYSLKLDGFIDEMSIPPLLTRLTLYSNKLKGSLPDTWPTGLTSLDV